MLPDILVRRAEGGRRLRERWRPEHVDDGYQGGLLGGQAVAAQELVHEGAELLGQQHDQSEGADPHSAVLAQTGGIHLRETQSAAAPTVSSRPSRPSTDPPKPPTRCSKSPRPGATPNHSGGSQ